MAPANPYLNFAGKYMGAFAFYGSGVCLRRWPGPRTVDTS